VATERKCVASISNPIWIQNLGRASSATLKMVRRRAFALTLARGRKNLSQSVIKGARVGGGNRRAGRRKRLTAILASVSLHLLVLGAIFISLGQTRLDEGWSDSPEGAMQVTLVGLPVHQVAIGSSTEAALLKARLMQAPEGIAASPQDSSVAALENLVERLRSTASSQQEARPQPASAPVAANALDEIANEYAGVGNPGGRGDLGRAVDPCWRRIAGSSRRPVKLSISLDHRGRLVAPPLILRPKSEPIDEPRLRSEAAAVAAVGACLAAQHVAVAAGTYLVELGTPQRR